MPIVYGKKMHWMDLITFIKIMTKPMTKLDVLYHTGPMTVQKLNAVPLQITKAASGMKNL